LVARRRRRTDHAGLLPQFEVLGVLQRGVAVTATAEAMVAGRLAEEERTRRARRRRRAGRTVLYHAIVLGLVAVVLYPGAWMLMSSLKPSSDIIGNNSLYPSNGSLDNFRTALKGIGGVS